MVIVHRQADLAEVIGALCPPRCLAGGLNRRQQQGHQDADDRDHDQQFDKRKAAAPPLFILHLAIVAPLSLSDDGQTPTLMLRITAAWAVRDEPLRADQPTNRLP